MNKKYYAVAIGRIPGIYLDKEACLAQTINYPGYKYKAFNDLCAAAAYIDRIRVECNNNGEHFGISPDISNNLQKINKSGKVLSESTINDIIYNRDMQVKEEDYDPGQEYSIYGGFEESVIIPQKVYDSDTLYLYTDGSYIKGEGYSGWSFILLPNKKYGVNKIIRAYGCCPNKEFSEKYTNIYGELEAVISAIMYVEEKYGKDLKIKIFHDLEGVGGWANNWKKNNEITKAYSEIIYKYRLDGMKIKFTKVAAHSGNFFNNMADKFAKKSVRELNPGSYRLEC